MPDHLPYELEEYVRERITGRIDDFHVERGDECLVLQGKSRSFYAKQLAQVAAREFAPQAPLSNEICVIVS